MAARQLKEARRRAVWAEAKAAAGAYARNPCKATEVQVETAVDHLRHLDDSPKAQDPKDQEVADEVRTSS
ncbi:MAG: hypothetical protein AAF495_02410 [Pseudomonadota bacterium]